MAKPRDPFFDVVEDLFAPLGTVTIKRMFGGAGVYLHGVMFGLLADGEVFVKVDEALRADLEVEGSEAFVFTTKNGEQAVMGYWRLPDTAADDPAEASAWGRRALDVALKAKAAGGKRNGKAKGTPKATTK
ncbi:MAG: TfoX/Sxy family protein [Pseudomonadota bacterium]